MTFYRGFDSKFGFFANSSFLWITDDFYYASEYGNYVNSCEINFDELKFAYLDVLENVCSELNYDYIDIIYNPTEYFVDKLRKYGFNAYTIEPMDYRCCCLLDKNLLLAVSCTFAKSKSV